MAISTKPPGSRTNTSRPAAESFTPSIVSNAANRSERAHAYEEKVNGILSLVMRGLAANEGTVADAAAFIEHGPMLAAKAGDLASHDARVRKAIDFIAAGSDNPYGAMIVASVPLIAQILRNHETDVAKPIEIRIPFTKKTFTPKIKIRLNSGILRGLTTTPMALIHKIFGNAEYREALMTAGIDVALPEYRTRVAGNQRSS